MKNDLYEKLLQDFFWQEERSRGRILLERKQALIERNPLYQKCLHAKQPEIENLKCQIEKKWDVEIIEVKPLKLAILGKREPIKAGMTDRKLFLEFDLGLLNKTTNTEKFVKEYVWLYIKKHLGEALPKDEVSLLYNCRKNTFDNHLKWYDLHCNKNLGFRVIALIEQGKLTLDKIKNNTVKWGKPVKGEDKIEKGIKFIYKAIRGSNYSQKKIKSIIESYNCPTHKNNCPASCKYYKNWFDDFNRKMPSS